MHSRKSIILNETVLMSLIRKISKSICGILIIIGATFSAFTQAAFIPAIDSYTGGTRFGVFYGDSTGDVVGFSFTADVNLTVSALGILNNGGLNSAHMVGLWNASNQSLLASTSVDSSGTLLNGFYFNNLASNVFLSAGNRYVLGAVYSATDDDSYVSGPSSISSNFISATQAVFASNASLGLVFPTNNSVGNLGRIGPNMLAQVSVSEPSALALLVISLAGFGLMRKARTQS